jgi:hypothetical protein
MSKYSDGTAAARVANIVLAVLLCPASALAWGNDGHEIVAIIAADNLSQAAQSHASKILIAVVEDRVPALGALSLQLAEPFRERLELPFRIQVST